MSPPVYSATTTVTLRRCTLRYEARRSVQIQEGMGHVIMPDWSIVQARAATVVRSPNGLYKTGFPIIGRLER